MKYQRLLNPDSQPPVGYAFIHSENKWESKAGSLDELIRVARLHRESNNFPIAENFAQLVETQLCQRSPGRCTNLDGTPYDESCIHQGDLIRWEGCTSCGGVRAKVLACALHGECTSFKRDIGVRQCWSCTDRVSALTGEAE